MGSLLTDTFVLGHLYANDQWLNYVRRGEAAGSGRHAAEGSTELSQTYF